MSRTHWRDAPARATPCYRVTASARRVRFSRRRVVRYRVIRNPARILGVADRVGSIEPGKHADIIVLDGPPFSVRT